MRIQNHHRNTTTYQNQHPEIDRETLTPLVRKTLNSKTAQVTGWECRQVHGGAGTGTAIYRVSGEGRDKEADHGWSLILKVLQPSTGNTEASTWNYYKREADAYRSGLLDDLQGGLKAPKCYAVTDRGDEGCWIWLEDVKEDIGPRWPVEHYGVAARQLGRFNGRYVNEDLPDWPWLSRKWMRSWVDYTSSKMGSFNELLDHPYVKLLLPGDQVDKMFGLWDEREIFFEALDRLPQTLCHLDAFRRNMFARRLDGGDYQTVLIDWAFIGRSPVGSEILPLVRATTSFFHVDLSDFKRLEEVVLSGYLNGLRDAGWRGDPKLVKLGYTASNIRYSFSTNLITSLIVNEEAGPRVRQTYGCSVEELLAYWGRCRKMFTGLDDQARMLMKVVG